MADGDDSRGELEELGSPRCSPRPMVEEADELENGKIEFFQTILKIFWVKIQIFQVFKFLEK